MLSIKSDQIAKDIWNKKKFAKTPSCYGFKEIKLTDKQHDLVTISLKSFKEMYGEILNIYKSTDNNPGLLEKLYNMIDRHFAFNRLNKGMGNTNGEVGGFARGLFVFYQLYKDEKNKKEVKKNMELKKELQPMVDFFGNSIEIAETIFHKFVVGMAIRFQFAIESLDKHEEGLNNFANYLAYMTIQKCTNKLDPENTKWYDTEEKKLKFMSSMLVMRSKENQDWKVPSLKTVGEETKIQKWAKKNRFDIDSLLLTSPIETPIVNVLNRGFWIYSGENKNDEKVIGLPTQLCSIEELETNKINYTLNKF